MKEKRKDECVMRISMTVFAHPLTIIEPTLS